MGSDSSSGENRRVFRLDRPDFDAGVHRLQRLADAGERAAGANAGTEAVNRSGDLFHDFQGGVVAVRLGIVRIRKLLRNKHARIVLFHLQRHFQAGGDTFADIAVIMYQNHFRAVVLHEHLAFL